MTGERGPDARRVFSPVVLNGGLALLLVALVAISVLWGEKALDLHAAVGDWLAGRPSVGAIILGQLRLPRTALAGYGGRHARSLWRGAPRVSAEPAR
jgi:hypothetical protein